MRKLKHAVGDWRGDQARLDHYNEWLMNRDIKETYPGYPGDTNKNCSYLEVPEQSVRVQEVTVASKPKKQYNRSIVRKHTQKGNEMKVTKLSQATEIVKSAKTKQEALADIQNALGVSKSNAFVYFTKATKILGTGPVKGEKVAKAPAKAKSKVTETSDTKVKAKVAEIDAVIAGLKANGAQVASPFAALVA